MSVYEESAAGAGSVLAAAGLAASELGAGSAGASLPALSTASIGSFPASSLSQFQSLPLSLSWLIATARIGAT